MEYPNGISYIRYPDGTVEHSGPRPEHNYAKTIEPNGTNRFRYADGVDLTVNYDGSLTYHNSNGSISTWQKVRGHGNSRLDRGPHWHVYTVHADGTESTARMLKPPPHADMHVYNYVHRAY